MDLSRYRLVPPAQILASVVNYLAARGSRFTNLKPGSRLRTLIEGFSIVQARISAEGYAAVRKARAESAYESFGYDLKPGNKSSGAVRIYNSGHTEDIPVPEFSVTLYGKKYVSQESPPTISVGMTFVDVVLRADQPGQSYDLDDGEIDTDEGLGDIEPLFTFQRIVNEVELSGGTDGESEAERDARFKDGVLNNSATLNGIRSKVLNVPGVVEAFVDENKNPITGDPEPCWVLVYVSDGSTSPPASLLDEVRRVVDGVLEDPAYPGARAAGVRSFIGTIQVEPVSLTLTLQLYDTSQISDAEAQSIAETAIREIVNRLTNGQDVILSHLQAAVREARRQDIFGLTIDSPASNVSILPGSVPKIGGPGGGTITWNPVQRVGHP